jgi:hypothetical protein
MPKTYEPIATYTATGTPSTYTFSSIPATYTDLVLVLSGTSNADIDISCRVNGDTGTNYSRTILSGNGSAASSSRASSINEFRLTSAAYWNSTSVAVTIAHFMNYSNTTTFKTLLTRSNNAGVGVDTQVELWRNTAAINQIQVFTTANNFANGSTFTLYGIKAA